MKTFNPILSGLHKLKIAMMKQEQEEHIKNALQEEMTYSTNQAAPVNHFEITDNNYHGYNMSGGTFNTYRNRK